MTIAERIRKRRIELDLSQEELANILGYKSRSSINKLEQGKADIPQSKIIPFSKALRCSPSYLLGLETEEQFKRNDTLTDIILELRCNNKLLKIVEKVRKLPYEKLTAIETLLSAFDDK